MLLVAGPFGEGPVSFIGLLAACKREHVVAPQPRNHSLVDPHVAEDAVSYESVDRVAGHAEQTCRIFLRNERRRLEAGTRHWLPLCVKETDLVRLA